MDGQRMRSPLRRARGLGSAREGVEHWWIQRATAVALIPLALWFMTSLIVLVRSDYSTVIVWLRTPYVIILVVLLLIALFYHAALGLQVVIEDYVHRSIKISMLVAIHFGCVTLAISGILAILRIAYTDLKP
jgi:succinate dehydrogenase / fumarate reductase, membrane anchor subunit